MMSWMRAASSRGIAHFSQNRLAGIWFQSTSRDDIDSLCELRLEQVLDSSKIEEVAVACQFHEHIDV